MAGNVISLTGNTFQTEVLQNSDQPVLVDFWAEWCAPCRGMAPIVEQLASEYAGKLKVAKLNVDDAPEIASQFGIMSIPTLIVFKDGEPVSRMVGLQSKESLARRIDAHV